MRTHIYRFAMIGYAVATLTGAGVCTTARGQDTVVIGTDHRTGGEGAGDRQTLDDIRQRTRDLRDRAQH